MTLTLAVIIASLATACVVMFRHNRELYCALVECNDIRKRQDRIIGLQERQINQLRDGL